MKIPVEECPSIDASLLAWRGVLDESCPVEDAVTYEELAGEYGSTRFERGWTACEVRLHSYEIASRERDGLLLRLEFLVTASRSRTYPAQGDVIHEAVRLQPRRCPLGGVRWWFRCYCCGRLRARLYLKWKSLTCRACQDLTYAVRSRYGRAAQSGGGIGALSPGNSRRLDRGQVQLPKHPTAPLAVAVERWAPAGGRRVAPPLPAHARQTGMQVSPTLRIP